MSSPQLLVPDHIAKSEKAKKSIAAAYVDEKDKYLDPSRLSKSLKERLPQPTGWRILVMPYMGKATSDGGIHIPDAVREREALATVVAYVLSLDHWLIKIPLNLGILLIHGAKKVSGFALAVMPVLDLS